MSPMEWLEDEDCKKKANKQEKGIAKFLGGRRTAQSGRYTGKRGDVETEDFMVEVKYTEAMTYILRLDYLRKLNEKAAKEGKDWVMIIEFLRRGDVKHPIKSLVVMDLDVFDELRKGGKDEFSCK